MRLQAIIVSACCVTSAVAATNSWNGGDGGWDSQNNWSLHQRPASNQDIVITNAGTFTVTVDDSTKTNTTRAPSAQSAFRSPHAKKPAGSFAQSSCGHACAGADGKAGGAAVAFPRMDGEEGRDSDGRGLRRRRAPANLLTTTSRKALCFRIHGVVGPERKTLQTRSPRRSAPCGIPVAAAGPD